MKKLEIIQMENLEGGGKGRRCFLMGLASGVGTAVGLLTPLTGGWAYVFGGGAMQGVYSAIDAGCFD